MLLVQFQTAEQFESPLFFLFPQFHSMIDGKTRSPRYRYDYLTGFDYDVIINYIELTMKEKSLEELPKFPKNIKYLIPHGDF